ncbi:Uncharacterized protein APZ42_008484, partial [Daphnia magna]
ATSNNKNKTKAFATYNPAREGSTVSDKWLYSKKDGKYARWILALEEFQIQIKHIKGHLNVVAVALSHFPVGEPEETDLTKAMCCTVVGSFHPPEEIALLQHDDKATRLIRMQLREDRAAENESFVLKKDVLYRKNRQAGRNTYWWSLHSLDESRTLLVERVLEIGEGLCILVSHITQGSPSDVR